MDVANIDAVKRGTVRRLSLYTSAHSLSQTLSLRLVIVEETAEDAVLEDVLKNDIRGRLHHGDQRSDQRLRVKKKRRTNNQVVTRNVGKKLEELLQEALAELVERANVVRLRQNVQDQTRVALNHLRLPLLLRVKRIHTAVPSRSGGAFSTPFFG